MDWREVRKRLLRHAWTTRLTGDSMEERRAIEAAEAIKAAYVDGMHKGAETAYSNGHKGTAYLIQDAIRLIESGKVEP